MSDLVFKICSKCKISKNLDDFTNDNRRKDGKFSNCKKCKKESQEEWKTKNFKYHSSYQKQWSFENREKVNEYANKSYYKNKIKIKERIKRDREKTNANVRRKIKENINFRIIKNLRTSFWKFMKGITKDESVLELLGIDLICFKNYIQNLFRDGMTWNNIHIDHIIPVSYFDNTIPKERKKAWHYTNMQPLFILDNLKKNDDLPLDFKNRIWTEQGWIIKIN